MDIIRDLQNNFSDEIDGYLTNDQAYQKAEEELHIFAENNIPNEIKDEFEVRLGRLISAVEHISVEAGMKIGAKIVAGLLK